MQNNSSAELNWDHYLSPTEILTFNIILPAITATGLFVNVIVIMVIITDRKMRKSSESIYIVNLAIADILVLCVGIPLWLYQLNYRDPNMISCQITTGVSYFSSFISVITLSTISVQRYLNVTKPFYSFQLNSKRIIFSVIFIGWAYSTMVSLPFFIGLKSKTFNVTIELQALCVYTRVFREEASLIGLSTGCLFMNVNILCYFKLLSVARYHERRIRQDLKVSETIAKRHSQKLSRERPYKATFKLGIILGSMIVCWSPFLVLSFIDIIVKDSNISVFTLKMSGTVTYLNSVMNPIIYTLLTKGFRESVRAKVFYIRGRCGTVSP